jgi:hypothetical protein
LDLLGLLYLIDLLSVGHAADGGGGNWLYSTRHDRSENRMKCHCE